jgi:Holliday junction resolvasome RuvABC endonuclease subunit
VVVGLDPSLSATGVFTNGLPWTITTKPTAKTALARVGRLSEIASEVTRHVPDGALVVMEGPGFSRGAQAGHHLLAGLWWLLALTIVEVCEADLVEVSPTTLKKFATGRGNATKADMRMALFKRTGLDLADDNQADAWWLWQIGMHLVGDPAALDLPKDQLAVLHPLRGQLPAPS